MTPDLQSQPGNDLTATLREARSEYERQTRAQAPPTLLKNLDVQNFWAAEEELLTQVPEHIEEHGYIEDKELLENIVLWKFPVVIGNIRENTPAQIATVSEHAFQAESARKAIQKLNELQGVADSIAGAILMFAHPHRYTVMDPRATMALETLGYWTGDTAAVDEQYESYCLRCHELSQQTGLPLRDVDRALYILGGED
ncbi:hypothetical protein [Halorubrum lacusprofundi]|jgi:hypothetical protein|uniref:hypothetical protein n=1 Tax=Halorubrum lacusprofundi TaxID=2247 RepID=UPI000B5A985F|nr:hypothetical protein [Halorubrum lacusprofundi]MCG1008192.1 hypothetical protein [Halorubrum lacusprofundi]